MLPTSDLVELLTTNSRSQGSSVRSRDSTNRRQSCFVQTPIARQQPARLHGARQAVSWIETGQVGDPSPRFFYQDLAGANVPIVTGIVRIEIDIRLSTGYLRELDSG